MITPNIVHKELVRLFALEHGGDPRALYESGVMLGRVLRICEALEPADFFIFDIDDFSKRWIEPTIPTRAA